MKQKINTLERTHTESAKSVLVTNKDEEIKLVRHPYYWQIKTGDMFTTLCGPQAIVVGLMKDIPGIEGINYGSPKIDLLGYAPLLYFEDAGKPSLWEANREPKTLIARKGLAGLSEESWRSPMGSNFKYFEVVSFLNPLEMLSRARNYVASQTPIYTGQDIDTNQDVQRKFLEEHRKDIKKFLEEFLEERT